VLLDRQLSEVIITVRVSLYLVDVEPHNACIATQHQMGDRADQGMFSDHQIQIDVSIDFNKSLEQVALSHKENQGSFLCGLFFRRMADGLRFYTTFVYFHISMFPDFDRISPCNTLSFSLQTLNLLSLIYPSYQYDGH
jgi:hypothetical protein